MKARFYLSDKLDKSNFEEAKEYLLDDDMRNYLDDNLKNKIDSIKWVLTDLDGGHIEIEENQELDTKDIEQLATYIEGQNSDGLGEGFNQQYFTEKEGSEETVVMDWGFDWC